MISDLEKILKTGEVLEEAQNMFEVDDKNAFLRLAENQFENPYDGVRELIANAIDSYRSMGKEPLVEIETRSDFEGKENLFTITDYGSGMDDEKIRLLTTLGLSDKKEGEIGRFGVGFSSIFSQKLAAKKVTVDTNNNGKHYRLVFTPKEKALPSLNIYELSDKIDFGTKIEIDSSQKQVIEDMEGTVVKTCRYMPYEVKLNGEIMEKDALKISGYRIGVDINKGNISGYIELKDFRSDTLVLLSKYILVESKEFKEFTDFNKYLGDNFSLRFFLPNISGVINNDKFDLVLSRNQIVEDTEFKIAKKVILSKSQDLLLKLLDEHKKSSSEYHRRIILENIVSGRGFFERDALTRLDSEKKDITNYKFLEKIFDAEVFQSWSGNYLSLKQILNKIGEKGHIIFSYNKDLVKILSDNDCQNVLLKKERTELGREGIFEGVYNYNTVIDLDISNIRELSDKNLVKLAASESGKIIDEIGLSGKYRSFIEEIRNILNVPEVRTLMKRYGLPDKVPVSYVELKNNSTIAQYDRDKRRIEINPNSYLVQSFLQSKNPGKNAPYFIPIISHELTHDDLVGHLEEFYNKNLTFDSEMRRVIANYIANTNPDSNSKGFFGFLRR